MTPSPPLPSRRAPTLALPAVLAVQFLPGMWVNLFVVVPRNRPGTSPDSLSGVVGGVTWALLHGPTFLQLHVPAGLTLGLMGAAHLVRALRRADPGAWARSAPGLTGLIAGAANGASFLNDKKDFRSMRMSPGLAIALVGYGIDVIRPARAGDGLRGAPAA